MLLHRLFSATIFLSIVFVAIFCTGWLGASVFILGACFLVWQSLKEFSTMINKLGVKLQLNPLYFFSFIYITIVLLDCLTDSISDITYKAFYILMFAYHFIPKKNKQKKLANYLLSLISFIYITWSLSFIAKIYFFNGLEDLGRYLMIFFILGVKSSDIGAYFTGKTCFLLFKKTHKIAPRVSPGKSWEGFFGGIFFSIFTCFTLYTLLADKLSINEQIIFPFYSIFIFGIIFSVLGFFGDLTESLLKRSSQMKDSATLIPGMGGALDVMDSLILTAPVFYSMLTYFTS